MELVQDLRHAIRSLRKSPGFALVAILTLALAIGANAVVFAVVKAILINPLPYADPDRLVTIVESDGRTPNPEAVADGTFAELKRQSHSFEQLSVWGDASIRLVDAGHADMIRGMRVSTNFFEALGVPMYLGRSFVPDEERPERAHAVILTYETWATRFGGDRTLVGRSIQAVDGAYAVIGVLPPDFHPLHMTNPAEWPRLFIPLDFDVARSTCRGASCRTLRAIGRLKRDVTVAQAQSELDRLMRGLVRTYPIDYRQDAVAIATPLRQQIVGQFGTALWMVEGAVLLLLALACGNVAALLLARMLARRTEMAVRAALGAGRWRLVRSMLTESVLLAGAAGAAGVSMAWSATRFLARTGNANLPRIAELAPDRTMLAFGVAASVVTILVFGVAPAMIASRGVFERLRAGSGSTAPPPYAAALRALIAVELSVAFIVVLAVGLLGKSYVRLMRVDPGYDAGNLLTVSLLPAGIRERLAYFDAVAARTRSIPGVEDVAYASTLPLSHPFATPVYIRERPRAGDADAPNLDTYLVSANYFEVMRIPVRRGRGFLPLDTATTSPVAVISESTARTQFRGTDPIGQHVQLARRDERQPWAVIVGVVGDVHQYGLDREADAAVYVPFAQFQRQGWASLVVRSTIPSERIEPELRKAMIAVDPMQPIFHLQPMTTYISLSVTQRTFVLALMAAFGGLTLVLAIAGVYGVVSYVVEQRTREVGLRLALGASPGAVHGMILRQVLRVAAIGAFIGFVVAIASSQFLSTLLFEVSPLDAETIAAVAVLLLLAALIASYRPVVRATRIDPAVVLKSE